MLNLTLIAVAACGLPLNEYVKDRFGFWWTAPILLVAISLCLFAMARASQGMCS